MGILQEYESHRNYLPEERMEALMRYLEAANKLYSDVIYKKQEWEEFEKWYNKEYGRGTKRDSKVQ